MSTYGTVYMKYPFESTWRDVTSKINVASFDIQERINTAGVCTMNVENADTWGENAVLAGFQFRIFLNDYDQPYGKPDFEGYVPPDFNPHLIGIEDSMDLPVVGYFDKHSRILYNGRDLVGTNVVSAIHQLNGLVVRPDGETWMDFQGELNPIEVVEKETKVGIDIKKIINEIRMNMVDSEDSFYPRHYHLVTTPQADDTKKPLLTLKKEPLLSGTAEIEIEWDDVLSPIQIDDNDTFLSTTLIGEKSGWSDKYHNENLRYMQLQLEKDIRSKDDGGLKSSREKGYTLYGVKDVGKSITLRVRRRHQIPLMTMLTLLNCPEVELQGNMIVYGKRSQRGTNHITELLVKSLPEEILLPA